MAYNEPDDKSEIENEIRMLEEEIAGLDNELTDICIQKKFLRHRLYDLEYQLKMGIGSQK